MDVGILDRLHGRAFLFLGHVHPVKHGAEQTSVDARVVQDQRVFLVVPQKRGHGHARILPGRQVIKVEHVHRERLDKRLLWVEQDVCECVETVLERGRVDPHGLLAHRTLISGAIRSCRPWQRTCSLGSDCGRKRESGTHTRQGSATGGSRNGCTFSRIGRCTCQIIKVDSSVANAYLDLVRVLQQQRPGPFASTGKVVLRERDQRPFLLLDVDHLDGALFLLVGQAVQEQS